MKALSFLGTGNYQETTYVFRGEECRTHLFPKALCEFFRPSDLLVFVTEEAEAKHFGALRERLQGRIEPQAVRIPMGRTGEELWQIFDCLAASVDYGDRVVFDITHAFRSIPLLVFIAAAYLRVVRSVTLEAITYGAFEARENDRTPVFDLSPFIVLLDWTTATDKFLKTGNAQELVQLLVEAHNLPYRASTPKADRNALPHHLKNIAQRIEEVSQAMRLVRPDETMAAAANLIGQLEQARPEAQRWAKPFALLLDWTREQYEPLALGDPTSELDKMLSIQLDLLQWYLERGQAVQATILAREWLVSYVAWKIGKDLVRERESVEDLLNDGVRAQEQHSPLPSLISQLPNAGEIVKTWGWLRDLRNDVCHMGMRKQPRKTKTILGDVDTLHSRLLGLWQASPTQVTQGD